MTFATRAKLAVLALIAGGVVVWLLLHDFVGHARVRAIRWRDLAPVVGPLELPREMSRVFSTPSELVTFLLGARYRSEPRIPRVDFDRRRVFLVSAGARSSSGYRLGVVRVVEQRRRIVVLLRLRNPTLAHPGRAQLTFPYALITLPAGGKHVHVDWVDSLVFRVARELVGRDVLEELAELIPELRLLLCGHS